MLLHAKRGCDVQSIQKPELVGIARLVLELFGTSGLSGVNHDRCNACVDV
jgi:hypothetical protein